MAEQILHIHQLRHGGGSGDDHLRGTTGTIGDAAQRSAMEHLDRLGSIVGSHWTRHSIGARCDGGTISTSIDPEEDASGGGDGRRSTIRVESGDRRDSRRVVLLEETSWWTTQRHQIPATTSSRDVDADRSFPKWLEIEKFVDPTNADGRGDDGVWLGIFTYAGVTDPSSVEVEFGIRSGCGHGRCGGR